MKFPRHRMLILHANGKQITYLFGPELTWVERVAVKALGYQWRKR